MPLKYQKYGIYTNYFMFTYKISMPTCMPHMKLLTLTM